jgi:hypothetical protein
MTTTAPLPIRIAADARARRAALLSGATGLAANVSLVLFYVFAEPFSATQNGAGWLGTASDWLEVPQFAALIPVAVAIGRRLPATWWVRALTVVGAAAMAVIVLAQMALVLGLLDFDVQVGVVVGAILALYLWLLGASLVGHRTGLLPRPVTRTGVLLGTSLPVGAALVAAGLLVPAPVRWALWAPGFAIGEAGWLALPVLPLLVARFVLRKEHP